MLMKLLWKKVLGKDYPIVAASFGGLFRTDSATVPGSKETSNWHVGLGLVYYDNVHVIDVNQVSILDGMAIVNGELIIGHDRLEEIRAAYPDWNW